MCILTKYFPVFYGIFVCYCVLTRFISAIAPQIFCLFALVYLSCFEVK